MQSNTREELFRRICDDPNKAWPEMNFVRHGNDWLSTYHTDPGRSKSSDKDKTIIRPGYVGMRDHTYGYISFIDYEKQCSNVSPEEAYRKLAKLYDITFTAEEEERYEREERERGIMKEAASKFAHALLKKEGGAAEVYDYLIQRGWTDGDIKASQLGYCDTAVLDTLSDSSIFADARSMVQTNRLAIPFAVGWEIKGFKFRNINYTDGSDKKKYLNTKGLHRGAAFFSIPGVVPKDITIVEGELDALRCKARGVACVVATAGGAVTAAQVADAIRRGAERFTLFFDADGPGGEFIEPSAAVITCKNPDNNPDQEDKKDTTLIASKDCSVFVADASRLEGCKDCDEYISKHGIEGVKRAIERAEPFALWKVRQLPLPDDPTAKDKDTYEKEVVKTLAGAPLTARASALEYLSNRKDLPFDAADLSKRIERAEASEKETRLKYSIKKEADKAIRLADTDPAKALETMANAVKKHQAEEHKADYEEAFRTWGVQECRDLLGSVSEGLPTGIEFGMNGKTEKLTLETGLTFVCGSTGHGKTTFLNNLAINEARRNIALDNGKSVLYFSYEVPRKLLIADLMITFNNEETIYTPLSGKSRPGLSANQQTAILRFEREHTLDGFVRGSDNRAGNVKRTDYKGIFLDTKETVGEHFKRKEQEFLKNYINSDALQVIDESFKIERLLEGIKFRLENSKRPVSLICIDYAQSIYSETFSRQRTEEIKYIVNEIKDFANKVELPIVLAAQFNRQVFSPASVSSDNIGEGGDFERIANTVLGIYNLEKLSAITAKSASDAEARDTASILGKLAGLEYLDDETRDALGNQTPLKSVDNALFVRLLKRRYGIFPLDAILRWNGNAKYIEPNDPEALEVKAETGDLYEDNGIRPDASRDDDDLPQ